MFKSKRELDEERQKRRSSVSQKKRRSSVSQPERRGSEIKQVAKDSKHVEEKWDPSKSTFIITGKPPQCYPSSGIIEQWKWIVRWYIVLQPIFDLFILICIIVNCVFVAISNPRFSMDHWQNAIGNSSEWAFNAIFVVEMLLKMFAFGLCRTNEEKEENEEDDRVEAKENSESNDEDLPDNYPPGYFRDGWNYIDFITVVFGLMSAMPSMSNLTFIRVVRVLRPLRTVKRIPQLRVLVNTVLNAFGDLLGAFILLFFLLVVLGIIGTQLFHGVLHQRCFYNPTGEILDEDFPLIDALDIPDFDVVRICTLGTGVFHCPNDFTCKREGPNLFDGVMSWDNILDTSYQVFQVSTLATWKEQMFQLQDGLNPQVWLYFVILIIFMEFIGFNLILAKLQDSYDSEQEALLDEQAEEEIKRKEAVSEANTRVNTMAQTAANTHTHTQTNIDILATHPDIKNDLKMSSKAEPRTKDSLNPTMASLESRNQYLHVRKYSPGVSSSTAVSPIASPMKSPRSRQYRNTDSFATDRKEDMKTQEIKVVNPGSRNAVKTSDNKENKAERSPRSRRSKFSHSRTHSHVNLPKNKPDMLIGDQKVSQEDILEHNVEEILYKYTYQAMARDRREIRNKFQKKFPNVRPSKLPLSSLFFKKHSVQEAFSLTPARTIIVLQHRPSVDNKMFTCTKNKEGKQWPLQAPTQDDIVRESESKEVSVVPRLRRITSRRRIPPWSSRRILRTFDRQMTLGFSWPSHREAGELPFIPVFHYYPTPFRSEQVKGLTFQENKEGELEPIFDFLEWFSHLGTRMKGYLRSAMMHLGYRTRKEYSRVTTKMILDGKFLKDLENTLLRLTSDMQHRTRSMSKFKTRNRTSSVEKRKRKKRRVGGVIAALQAIPRQINNAIRCEKLRRDGVDSDEEIEKERKKLNHRARSQHNIPVPMKRMLSLQSTSGRSESSPIERRRSNSQRDLHARQLKHPAFRDSRYLTAEELARRKRLQAKERRRRLEQKAEYASKAVETKFTNEYRKKLFEVKTLSQSYVEAVKSFRLQMAHTNKYPKLLFLSDVVRHNVFNWIIMLCIIANTVVLAWDHYGIDSTTETRLENANLFFTIVFTIEMVLKLLGMGYNAYIADGFNILDGIIVFASLVELGIGQKGSASAFRAIRVLRLIKLLKHVRSMRALVLVIREAVEQAAWLMVLVCLFFFMFAVAGVQLFAGRLHVGPEGEPRWSFNDLWASTLTVFMMATGDSWIDVIWDLVGAGEDSVTAQIYGVIVMLVGMYIITNLFVAVLLSQFDQGDTLKFKTVLFYDLALPLLCTYSMNKAEEENKKKGVPNLFETLLMDGLTQVERNELVQKIMEDLNAIDNEEKTFILTKSRLSKKESRGAVKGYVIDIPNIFNSLGRAQLRRDSMSKSAAAIMINFDRVSVEKDEKVMPPINRAITAGTAGSNDASAGDGKSEVTDDKKRKTKKTQTHPPGSRIQLMGADWTIRHISKAIVSFWGFESIILALIVVNCFFLSAQNPKNGEGLGLPKDQFTALDALFTSIFGIEMGLKILAFGLVGGEESYLSNAWDRVDGVVVVFMALSFIPGLQVLKVFGALRPIRILVRIDQPRVVLESLLDSVPSILNVFFLCALIFLTFAIFMISRFKGALYVCEDASIEDVNTRQECEDNDGTWTRLDSHFDNIGGALVSLFLTATTSGWNVIMYSCIDARGPDLTPKVNSSPEWGLFFVIYIFITAFFALNLLVGVLIDNFRRLKELNEGSAFLTEAQRQWVRIRKIMSSTVLMRVCEPERMNGVRRVCYYIVGDPAPRRLRAMEDDVMDTTLTDAIKPQKSSQNEGKKVEKPEDDDQDEDEEERKSLDIGYHLNTFDIFILVCILLNTLVLTIPHYQQPEGVDQATYVLNIIFTIIFVIEAMLKIIAWKFKGYWRDSWNRFDFVVAVASFVGIFLNSGAISVVRVFRVARSVRLMKMVPGLSRLFRTLITTLPSIINIGILIIIFLFMFAILGRQLFFRVEKTDGGFSPSLNYDTVENGMLSLWIAMTGDAWEEQMYGATREGGTSWAPLYFVLFMLIMAYVMVELFLAAILENFENAKDEDDIAAEELSQWRDHWQEMDPKGSGFLPPDRVASIILYEDRPLGCGIKKKSDIPKPAPIWMLRRFRLLHVPLYRTKLSLKQYGYFHGVKALRRQEVIDLIYEGRLHGKLADDLEPHLRKFGLKKNGEVDKKLRKFLREKEITMTSVATITNQGDPGTHTVVTPPSRIVTRVSSASSKFDRPLFGDNKEVSISMNRDTSYLRKLGKYMNSSRRGAQSPSAVVHEEQTEVSPRVISCCEKVKEVFASCLKFWKPADKGKAQGVHDVKLRAINEDKHGGRGPRRSKVFEVQYMQKGTADSGREEKNSPREIKSTKKKSPTLRIPSEVDDDIPLLPTEKDTYCVQWICKFQDLLDRLAAIRSNVDLSHDGDADVLKPSGFTLADWWFYNVFIPERLKFWRKFRGFLELWGNRLIDRYQYEDKQLKALDTGKGKLRKAFLKKKRPGFETPAHEKGITDVAARIRGCIRLAWHSKIMRRRLENWWKRANEGKAPSIIQDTEDSGLDEKKEEKDFDPNASFTSTATAGTDATPSKKRLNRPRRLSRSAMAREERERTEESSPITNLQSPGLQLESNASAVPSVSVGTTAPSRFVRLLDSTSVEKKNLNEAIGDNNAED